MKILFLCGSPRKKGNTATILKKVAEKVSEHNDVEICYITDYKVNGCLGCSVCQSNLDEPGCVQKDEAHILLNKVIEADIVFYGTPLYGHSFSGQLKILFDRHVALFKFVGGSEKAVDEMEIRSFIKDKKVALIVSCQGPEENNTELIKMQFDKVCESSLSCCIGKYIFPWSSSIAKETVIKDADINRIVVAIEKNKLK